MHLIKYRRQFSRSVFFREWMVGRALRRRKPDFTRERPMVSIIGDTVSDVIRAEQLYERDVLEFLRASIFDLTNCRSQIALDVGANIGNHSLFLSELFARVIAFEPNPLARSLLHLNLKLNGVENVDVRPIGLSDRNASTTLKFEPINLGAATSSDAFAGASTTRQSSIDLAIGDEIIGGAEPVGFIKVDVEGAEEAALIGLRETINTYKPIIMIEQWPDVINADEGTSPATSLLHDLGYGAWEIRTDVMFTPPWGKLTSLLLGRTDHRLVPIDRLEVREYPAIIFLPLERSAAALGL